MRHCCAYYVCGLLFLALHFNPCNGRHGMDRKGVGAGYVASISCYECNSQYDPRCGDPFDPYTIGIVNCSMKRPLDHITEKPTLCRKTVQKVEGETRVIRGCGYIPDARDDKACIRRTGTHNVQMLYCSCKTGLCNGAGTYSPYRDFSFLFAFCTVIFFLVNFN